MEFPICRLTVKELREIAKKMGLAHKGLKKCQLILLLERNGANQQEPEELEFPDVEVEYPDELDFSDVEDEYPDVVTQRLRFGDTKKDMIPYSKTKGKKSRGTKSTRTLTEEDLKNFIPRNVLKKQAKKNKFFELEEAVPSQSMYSKKPIDIKRNWNTNYKVGKYLPMLEFETEPDLPEEEITFKTNPYKVLGVNKSSSLEEIKRAYKKQSLKYHPDRLSNKSKEEQEKSKVRFQIINNAYQDILSNIEDKYSDEEMNRAREEYEKRQQEYERRMSELDKRFEEMRKESEEQSKQYKQEQKEKTENMMKNKKFRDRMIELDGMTKEKLIEEVNKITDKKNMKRQKLKSYGKYNLISKIVDYEYPDDDIIIFEEQMKEYIKEYKKKQPQPQQKKKSKIVPEEEELDFSDVIFEKEPKPKKSIPVQQESDELDFSDVIFEKEPESSLKKIKEIYEYKIPINKDYEYDYDKLPLKEQIEIDEAYLKQYEIKLNEIEILKENNLELSNRLSELKKLSKKKLEDFKQVKKLKKRQGGYAKVHMIGEILSDEFNIPFKVAIDIVDSTEIRGSIKSIRNYIPIKREMLEKGLEPRKPTPISRYKNEEPPQSKPAPIIEYTEDEMEDLQNNINILLDSPKEELNQIILEETGQDGRNLTEEQIIKKILIDVQGHPADIVNKMKIRLKKSTQQQSKQQSQPPQKQKSTLVNITILDKKEYDRIMSRPLSASIQRAYEEILTNKQFDKSNEIQAYVAENLKEERIIKY